VRLAYFDCFSGISGDMALGALIHAGADLDGVLAGLGSLPVEGFQVEREEAEDHGIWATRIHVKVKPQALVRTYSSIRDMLEAADLPEGARRTADRIFHRLAQSLARVHGKELGVVTFHEMGEIETVVEIVGCALALDLLQVERVFASAVPTGMGMVRTEHGVMPIPGPEVMDLLQAVPTYTRGVPVDLVTPVGAATLAAIVEGFGDMPTMRAELVGYGAGHPRLDFPNVLRVVIGEEERSDRRGEPSRSRTAWDVATAPEGVPELATIGAKLSAVPERGDAHALLVQATLIGPRQPEKLLGRLMHQGAAEAWLTPVVTRLGEAVEVSAITPTERRDDVVRLLQSNEPMGPIRFSTVRLGSD